MAGIPVLPPAYGVGSPTPKVSGPAVTEEGSAAPMQQPINWSAGTFEQVQQSPAWLQEQIKGRMIKEGRVGFRDPSLQVRDIYSGYRPMVQEAIQKYGQEAFNNPYFYQNRGEFGNQMNYYRSGGGFDPMQNQLYDYEVQGPYGALYRQMKDPFTGEVLGQSLEKRYADFLGPHSKQFKGGVSQVDRRGFEPYKQYVEGWDNPDSLYSNYINKYWDVASGR